MNEMIERVAIAICENEIGGKLPGTLDDTGYESAKYWRKLGRMAIAAMREPTDAMVQAIPGGLYGQDDIVRKHWAAMIDEALK